MNLKHRFETLRFDRLMLESLSVVAIMAGSGGGAPVF